MAKRGSGRDEITVVLPPEPPELNPEAARAMLRILLKAYEKKYGRPYTPGAEPEPEKDAPVAGAGAEAMARSADQQPSISGHLATLRGGAVGAL
jgi:hypothetical protein